MLERIIRIVTDLQRSCRSNSMSSDDIHRYRIRLSQAIRTVESSNVPTLVGNDCYLNIMTGIRDMLTLLEQLDDSSQQTAAEYGATTESSGGGHVCTCTASRFWCM